MAEKNIKVEKSGSSLVPSFRTRIKYGSSYDEFDIVGYYCSNPDCPCNDVKINFYKANGHVDDMLFKITLNYKTWELTSTEIYNTSIDCAKLIHEFMKDLNVDIKEYILSGKAKSVSERDILRTDINYSGLKIDSMVYYSEIYYSRLYEQLIFEFENTQYFVMDYYCVNPKCNCNDVILVYHVIKGQKALDEPLLELRVNLKNAKYTLEKNNGFSTEQTDHLYRELLMTLGENGIGELKDRYNRIKKWSREELVHKLKIYEPIVLKQQKIGRNELCPCGSGKKYKKCCGV